MRTQSGELSKDIKSRHLMMIAFGGAIGAGFFVGTGETIAQAGPLGAVLAYLVGAIIVYSIMLSLGEISSVLALPGSYGEYASKFIGPFTGYYVYWAYFINCLIGNAIQYITIAFLMQKWLPESPMSLWICISCAIVFFVNFYRVKYFAEIEFYLSLIKVTAIVIFLAVGSVIIIYKLYTISISPFSLDAFKLTFSNFYDAKAVNPFFPNGGLAVFSAIVFISFAFAGTEAIGTAVAETQDPATAMPRAVKATAWRMLIFFVGGVFVVSTFLPQTDASLSQSPFVLVLHGWEIPYADDFMNALIIIAIFSSSNTGIYSGTRMLAGLSSRGFLPKKMGFINHRGIPIYALYTSTLVSLSALLVIFLDPEKVMAFMIVVAGLSFMLVWMSISIAQMNFRKWFVKTLGKSLDELPYKTPFTPYIQIIGLLGCALPLVVSAIDGEYRESVWWTLGGLVFLYFTYWMTRIFNKENVILDMSDEELMKYSHLDI